MTENHTIPERLCIDASLVLNFILQDERNAVIDELWRQWIAQGIELIGPALLYSEVISAIRLRAARGRLRDEREELVLQSFLALGVQRIDRAEIYPLAWELARRYRLHRVYDTTYLALAELEELEFWTGDERLVNALAGREPRVRWLPVDTA